jgi:transglutaminase-like putative cysteine protease
MRAGIRWEKVVPVKQPAELLPAGGCRPSAPLARSTPLLDLEDPKLRLRVRALTQLCKSERDKALAVYRFVKRLPVCTPFKARLHTARQVLDAGRGDAPDKATLLVAMLRAAGIPARIRCITLDGRILRGLTSAVRQANRPVLEMWLPGEWQQTDTYIYDADTMAARASA